MRIASSIISNQKDAYTDEVITSRSGDGLHGSAENWAVSGNSGPLLVILGLGVAHTIELRLHEVYKSN